MADSTGDSPSMAHTTLGSAMSGLISRSICHPIDTLKARLQGADGGSYRGIIHCLRTTLLEEGILGLYRGFGAVAALGTPAACIYMTSYEILKGKVNVQENPFLGPLAAGMGAEAMACIVFVPVDVVKERLQVQRVSLVPSPAESWRPPKYSGSFSALQSIVTSEGLFGIYKGYWATLGSFGPFSAFYFLFYEKARSLLSQMPGGGGDPASLPPSYTMAASSVAGSAASALTNPLDLAKLRLQTQRRLNPGEPVPEGYLQGLPQAIARVYHEGGLRALFRGTLARVAFHTPNVCISFTCFEECRKLVQKVL